MFFLFYIHNPNYLIIKINLENNNKNAQKLNFYLKLTLKFMFLCKINKSVCRINLFLIKKLKLF